MILKVFYIVSFLCCLFMLSVLLKWKCLLYLPNKFLFIILKIQDKKVDKVKRNLK